MFKIQNKNPLIILFFVLAFLNAVFFYLRNQQIAIFPEDFLASVINTENIISLTNKAREKNNARELSESPKLSEAAEHKALDMLQNQYFSHTTPEGKDPWEFMKEVDYYYLYAGENLAVYFETSEAVLHGWLTSPKHRENILSPNYTEIGVGIARGKFKGFEAAIVVQMFGAPLNVTRKPFVVYTPRLRPSSENSKVKGVSSSNEELQKYIANLEQGRSAVWNPRISARELYSFAEPREFFDEFYWLTAVSAVLLGGYLIFARKKTT